MNEKAYTVSEIDALRQACEDRWLYGTTNIDNFPTFSRQYRSEEKDTGVEELVRTYMMAGITASDIYEADKPKPPPVPESLVSDAATNLNP